MTETTFTIKTEDSSDVEDDTQLSSSSFGFTILPERQAKVATLVSMINKTDKDKETHKTIKTEKKPDRPTTTTTEDSEPAIYCLCRSSDCTKFMIACDHCEEWYHGRCVGVEEAAAKFILKYACPPCRDRDPTLYVKYKEKKEKKEKPKGEEPKLKKPKAEKPKAEKPKGEKSSEKKIKKKKKELLKEKKMKMKMKMKMKLKKKEKDRERRLKHLKLLKRQEKEREKEKGESPGGEKTGASDASGDYSPFFGGPKLNKAAQRANRRCGECLACNITDDCGECDFCLDMKKFGGPNKIRQKCRLRQCLRRASKNFLKPAGLKKHKHPQERARYDSGTSLDTDTDASHGGYTISHVDHHDYAMRPELNPMAMMKRQLDEEERRRTERMMAKKEKKKLKKKKEKEKKKQRQIEKEKKKKKKLKKKVKVIKVQRELRKRTASGAVKQTRQSAAGGNAQNLPQCYGPGCTEPARTFSKYCSEECGLKLATNRIFELLPQRIQQWQQSPCIAEENNKKSLEQMRSEMEKVKHKIAELDAKIVKLQKITVKAKAVPIKVEKDSTDNEEEPEASVNCVTCGHSINPTKALMHMNKCFRKYESQTSYGSAYKTRIVGESMFCDYFNTQQNTYCKRLKVLCPEHTKEPKVSEKEVCGCPLVADVFKDTGQYCPLPKRKCTKHHNWEKLRRAEIDLERVRWWLRLDDLLEQERNVKTAMTNRAGVLGLMLHQTIDHSLIRQVPQPQQAETAN